MAHIANPRKVFNFRVEILGVDQFEVQKVTLPETEIESVEHGDTNHKIKTAGQLTFGDMTMEKLRPSPNSDIHFWTWLMAAQDPDLGGGVLPIGYKQVVIVKEMDSLGTFTLNSWLCTGVWVKKVSQNDLDRTSSENIIETVVFSVDKCRRL